MIVRLLAEHRRKRAYIAYRLRTLRAYENYVHMLFDVSLRAIAAERDALERGEAPDLSALERALAERRLLLAELGVDAEAIDAAEVVDRERFVWRAAVGGAR